jgi:DNA-binding Lrp family transcriptional regulator
VTGVSDQTAARRYRRLTQVAGLRVLAAVNGERAGWADWFVRLQTTPGSADAIADALAKRPDTRWVRLVSGGAEIVCTLQARTQEQRDALLLQGLPGSRRVVQISAHSILEVFSRANWQGLTQALSPAQIAVLEPSHTVLAPDAVSLQPDDEPLLAELARDARATHAAIAAAIHWHESTVRRRIAELVGSGLLYFDVDIDDTALGINVAVMFWLSVEPARLEAVGRAIAAQPEVPFAAATTGSTNLVTSALLRDNRHMYEYLTGRLGSLPGVRSVESAPVIGTRKRSGALRSRTSGLALGVAERAGVRRDVNRVLLERGQRHDLQRPFVRRRQHDGRGHPFGIRPQPVRGGHAPPVAWYQPGEPELRHRRRQIVSDATLVLKERGCHHRADRVTPLVFGPRVAAAVPVEAGKRIISARFKFAAEHITVTHHRSIRIPGGDPQDSPSNSALDNSSYPG